MEKTLKRLNWRYFRDLSDCYGRLWKNEGVSGQELIDATSSEDGYMVLLFEELDWRGEPNPYGRGQFSEFISRNAPDPIPGHTYTVIVHGGSPDCYGHVTWYDNSE